MENRKRITEEDLRTTEALIAESYTRLKHSVARAPYRAFRSAGDTVSRHPLAAIAVAAGAGLAVYGLIKTLSPHGGARETETSSPAGRTVSGRNRPDLMGEMLSMIFPLIIPYLTAYLRQYAGRIFSGKCDDVT